MGLGGGRTGGMQPLFEGKIDYLQKKVGLGKAGIIRLFADHVEIIDKTGALLANIPLASITSASYVRGSCLG